MTGKLSSTQAFALRWLNGTPTADDKRRAATGRGTHVVGRATLLALLHKGLTTCTYGSWQRTKRDDHASFWASDYELTDSGREALASL